MLSKDLHNIKTHLGLVTDRRLRGVPYSLSAVSLSYAAAVLNVRCGSISVGCLTSIAIEQQALQNGGPDVKRENLISYFIWQQRHDTPWMQMTLDEQGCLMWDHTWFWRLRCRCTRWPQCSLRALHPGYDREPRGSEGGVGGLPPPEAEKSKACWFQSRLFGRWDILIWRISVVRGRSKLPLMC